MRVFLNKVLTLAVVSSLFLHSDPTYAFKFPWQKDKEDKEEEKKESESTKSRASCRYVIEELHPVDAEICNREEYMVTVDCIGGNCSDNIATNPWADVAAVGLAGLAMVGGIAVQGHFQNKSQEAWAASFTAGQEECTTRPTLLLDTTERGADHSQIRTRCSFLL